MPHLFHCFCKIAFLCLFPVCFSFGGPYHYSFAGTLNVYVLFIYVISVNYMIHNYNYYILITILHFIQLLYSNYIII